MPDIDLKGFPGEAGKVFLPFAQDLLRRFSSNCLSISITGSCMTGDYTPGISDINSVLVLKKTSREELEALASLSGYKKRRVASPLVMTEEYIERSLDVFPIEFLDIKLYHKTIYGTDFFDAIPIHIPQLRLQCERDLKAKLINLQRGYVACGGASRGVRSLLLQALPGYFALLRAMIYLLQSPQDPPARKLDVLPRAEELFHVSLSCLKGIMRLRESRSFFPDRSEVLSLFDEACRITHDLCVATDALGL